MNRRLQFRLVSIFGVILVAALLANIARLGGDDIALFLGGAILGSFAARRFLAAVIGGALGGTAVALLFLCWALMTQPPGAGDLRNVPGMIPFVMASVAVGTLIFGAAVGAVVWVIKTLWLRW